MNEPPSTELKRLHVITWGCQMNVYDSGRMADVLAPLGYAPAAGAGGRRHGHPQHLPYPRQGGGEGVLRTRPAAPAEGGGRGRARMILAVAGCVAQAEGARNPRPRALRRHRARARRPTTGCRKWWPGRPAPASAVIETDFPPEDKFDHLPESAAAAGRDRVPDHPGRLRQILQLLRRALHPRRRAKPARPRPSCAEARRLVPQGAREITLLGQNVNAWHGEAPEGGTGASAGCCARWPKSPDCCGCATPPRTRATWTTT